MAQPAGILDAGQEDLAEAALRKALLTKPSEEAERRITLLLNRIDSPIPLPVDLRIIRATAVLERMGTTEARTLLEELSKGAPDARQTKVAYLALLRLDRLKNAKP
jgi:hypothetical protein